MRGSFFAMIMAAAMTVAAQSQQYDLVIYGGTASGVMTAVSAARGGLKVALVEPGNHLGGMVSGGLTRTDFGRKEYVGGIAREFYERLGNHYKEPITWYHEPGVAEATFEQMLKEASVTVVRNSRLREKSGVTKESGKITAIVMENGQSFKAPFFIDCSYEGDVMAQAGVKYRVGRESTKEYGESLAGVRDKTPKHQFKVNVRARDENGKLLPEISSEPRGEDGAADKRVQAYNFRLCMTTNTENMVPFKKPDNYDPARYKLLARMIEAHVEQDGAPPRVADLMHPAVQKNGKTDTNNNGAFSTDYIGKNYEYPDGDYATRAKIWKDHQDYIAGFMYFLGHDEQVPEVLRNEMLQWGLAKDEFVDNDNWPHQLYIREARRMVGEYVQSQADIQTSRTKPDSIGMGTYNSDSHNVQRIENAQGFAENEGDMQVSVKPYEIPYRTILPKRDQVENLLVPVCCSATHVAYSTVRMEPVYMIMGQAAGIATAIAKESGKGLHDIDRAELARRLADAGAVLHEADAAKHKGKP